MTTTTKGSRPSAGDAPSHVCGASDAWDRAGQLRHRCGCGAEWDQHENIARNMLAAHGDSFGKERAAAPARLRDGPAKYSPDHDPQHPKRAEVEAKRALARAI